MLIESLIENGEHFVIEMVILALLWYRTGKVEERVKNHLDNGLNLRINDVDKRVTVIESKHGQVS